MNKRLCLPGSAMPDSEGLGRFDILLAMKREHEGDCLFDRKSGDNTQWREGAEKTVVNPQAEWNIVLLGEEGSQYYITPETLEPRGHTPKIKKRDKSQPLSKYVDLARAGAGREASTDRGPLLETTSVPCCQLRKEEVVALRLWTGPMYKRYARFLDCLREAPAPQGQSARYDVTVLALSSGIVKLAGRAERCSEPLAGQTVIYRGLRSLHLDSQVVAVMSKAGVPPFRTGTQPSALAFSHSYEVARENAIGGVVLKYDMTSAHSGAAMTGIGSSPSRGADITWLSQFPDQMEILFPPFSRLTIVDGPQSPPQAAAPSGGTEPPEWGVVVVACCRCATLEELFGPAGILQ